MGAFDRGGLFGRGGLTSDLFSGIGSLFTLSDARAKEDIRRVGEADNGLPIYAYRYKGQPTTQIGFMAQEVAQERPEAVGVFPGGFLGVNYDLATV